MKFSDFKNNPSNKTNTKENSTNSNDMNTGKIEEMIAQFSSLSEEELFNEFFKLSNKKKKDGTLNDAEINKMKNALSGYLSDEQKQNLDKIINLVR